MAVPADIDSLITQVSEIVQTEVDQLIQNYKFQSGGGPALKVEKIRAQVSEFQSMLKLISRDALECLPDFEFNELRGAIGSISKYLDQLHKMQISDAEAPAQKSGPFVAYFALGRVTESNQNYVYFRPIIWRIIVSSISLLNFKESHGSTSEKIEQINKNFSEAKEVKEKIDKLFTTAQDELTERGVSKHAKIFSAQADKHQTNTIIWGVLAALLSIGDAVLIVSLFSQIKNYQENEIEFGVLSLLLISLLSFVLVISLRNFFSEKHNQAVNRHKANCLDSYNTFIGTASDSAKDVILQYVTQTIFSPYNPGYLNKDSIQSPLPLIELLRTVKSESRKTE